MVVREGVKHTTQQLINRSCHNFFPRW
jgi:hypothetical protein